MRLTHAYLPAGLLGLALYVLSGCSSSSVQGTWRDPAYRGPAFTKIMVMPLTNQPETRQIFETQFVNDLSSRGAQGIASYTLITEAGPVSVDRLKQAVKESGAQAVLTVRLINKQTRTAPSGPTYGPAYYGTYGSYYSGAWSVPEYSGTYQYDVYTLQANLYDAATEKVVWASTLQTSDPNSREKAIVDLAQIIVNALVKEKLIP